MFGWNATKAHSMLRFLVIGVDTDYTDDLKETIELGNKQYANGQHYIESVCLAVGDDENYELTPEQLQQLYPQQQLQINKLKNAQYLSSFNAIIYDSCARRVEDSELGNALEEFSTVHGGGLVFTAHIFHCNHSVYGKAKDLLPMSIGENAVWKCNTERIWKHDKKHLLDLHHPIFEGVEVFNGGTYVYTIVTLDSDVL